MKPIFKTWLLFISALFLFSACCVPAEPKSVILMIGDGMGPEQVKAASLYLYGEEGRLGFEALPVKGSVSTYSANSSITDSAAAATAMATGHKVSNGVISRAIPGDGSDLETVLEAFKAAGKSTGIVTTTAVTHATPAAFSAHADSRNNYSGIADDLFNVTKPDVIFGGGGAAYAVDLTVVQAAGYSLARNASELEALSGVPAAGIFGTDHLPYEYDGLGEYPHLHETALKALELLDGNPNGFFLLIEGGRIDHACHSNDITRAVFETVEFSKTVQAILDRIGNRSDILLIVTVDHETGGLKVTANNGKGYMPSVTWATGGHTGIDIPIYSKGPGSERLGGTVDNTGINKTME